MAGCCRGGGFSNPVSRLLLRGGCSNLSCKAGLLPGGTAATSRIWRGCCQGGLQQPFLKRGVAVNVHRMYVRINTDVVPRTPPAPSRTLRRRARERPSLVGTLRMSLGAQDAATKLPYTTGPRNVGAPARQRPLWSMHAGSAVGVLGQWVSCPPPSLGAHLADRETQHGSGASCGAWGAA